MRIRSLLLTTLYTISSAHSALSSQDDRYDYNECPEEATAWYICYKEPGSLPTNCYICYQEPDASYMRYTLYAFLLGCGLYAIVENRLLQQENIAPFNRFIARQKTALLLQVSSLKQFFVDLAQTVKYNKLTTQARELLRRETRSLPWISRIAHYFGIFKPDKGTLQNVLQEDTLLTDEQRNNLRSIIS